MILEPVRADNYVGHALDASDSFQCDARCLELRGHGAGDFRFCHGLSYARLEPMQSVARDQQIAAYAKVPPRVRPRPYDTNGLASRRCPRRIRSWIGARHNPAWRARFGDHRHRLDPLAVAHDDGSGDGDGVERPTHYLVKSRGLLGPG